MYKKHLYYINANFYFVAHPITKKDRNNMRDFIKNDAVHECIYEFIFY
jgi:hypothetical protein